MLGSAVQGLLSGQANLCEDHIYQHLVSFNSYSPKDATPNSRRGDVGRGAPCRGRTAKATAKQACSSP